MNDEVAHTGPGSEDDSGSRAALAIEAFVGLGANLGSPAKTLAAAVVALDGSAGVRVVACSSLWRSAPVGDRAQPDYLNAVAALRTNASAGDLLSRLLEIERRFGRRRSEARRWAPRTLDLDLLVFGDEQIDQPGLTVPHQRLAERRFVLEPLAELIGDRVLAPFERTVAQLAAARRDDPEQEIEKLEAACDWWRRGAAHDSEV